MDGTYELGVDLDAGCKRRGRCGRGEREEDEQPQWGGSLVPWQCAVCADFVVAVGCNETRVVDELGEELCSGLGYGAVREDEALRLGSVEDRVAAGHGGMQTGPREAG